MLGNLTSYHNYVFLSIRNKIIKVWRKKYECGVATWHLPTFEMTPYKTKDYMQITPLLKSLRQFMWHMKYTLYASNNQIHTIFLLLVFLWALKRRNMKYTLLLIQFNFDHVCKNCICIVVVQTTWTYFLARFFWFKDKSAFFFVVWNLMSFENSL